MGAVGDGWSRARWWQLLEPSADEPDVAATLDQLLAIARGTPADAPIDVESPKIRRLLNRHRVATVIPLEAVRPGARADLRARHIEIAAAQLRLRLAAAEVIDALRTAGVDTRVLKGLATADLDYPETRLRHGGDVDLAVAPDDLDRAMAALVAAGCIEQPQPFDPVLWYGRTLITTDGVEIDIHTRLFRRSPLGMSLLDEPGEALHSLPGEAFRPEQRFVHAAGHFLISPPGTRRMNGFLDIARLLDRSDLDLDVARRFANRLGVERLVGAGIRVEATLSERTDVLRQLDDWQQPDLLERQTRLVAHRRLVLDHLARYREVPPGNRLAYLPAWLFPSAPQRRLLRTSASSATARIAASARSRGRLSR